MKDDFHGLDASRHMLAWVGLGEDDPYGDLREHFEDALVTQDEGSVLEWVRLVGEPDAAPHRAVAQPHRAQPHQTRGHPQRTDGLRPARMHGGRAP